jgi:hypothetical protein
VLRTSPQGHLGASNTQKSSGGQARYTLLDVQTGDMIDAGTVDDTSEFYFDA